MTEVALARATDAAHLVQANHTAAAAVLGVGVGIHALCGATRPTGCDQRTAGGVDALAVSPTATLPLGANVPAGSAILVVDEEICASGQLLRAIMAGVRGWIQALAEPSDASLAHVCGAHDAAAAAVVVVTIQIDTCHRCSCCSHGAGTSMGSGRSTLALATDASLATSTLDAAAAAVGRAHLNIHTGNAIA